MSSPGNTGVFYWKNFAGKILGICLFRGIDRNDDDNSNDTAGCGVVAAHHRFFCFWGVRSFEGEPILIPPRPALHVRESDPAVLSSSPYPPIFGGISSVQNTADSKAAALPVTR